MEYFLITTEFNNLHKIPEQSVIYRITRAVTLYIQNDKIDDHKTIRSYSEGTA